MIGFLFSLLRFKLCFQSLQIPSTKKAGQISPVPTWALNTLFMGDLQGEMGENCKPVQQFNSSLSPSRKWQGRCVFNIVHHKACGNLRNRDFGDEALVEVVVVFHI